MGDAETEGFREQTRRYAGHWPGSLRIEVPGADHYSILRELARPDGVVLQALRERLATEGQVA